MYLLTLTIIFAAFNSLLLHKVKLQSNPSVYLFGALTSAVWLMALFSLNGFQITFSTTALIFGIAYGVTQALFVFFKTMAMNTGPVSVTTLVGNASLLVSVIVCYFVWDEPIGLPDALGLLALLAALFITTYKKGDLARRKVWYIYSLLFLITAAGVGISFKAFSKSRGACEINDMMIVAAAVMLAIHLILFALSALSSRHRDSRSENFPRESSFYLIGIGQGILSCLYNRLNIYLSGELDAVIFFPFFNGGVVILSALLSALFFKERLTPRQLSGFALGILAITVIGIF